MRWEIITRLKQLYLSYGGNKAKINPASFFKKIFHVRHVSIHTAKIIAGVIYCYSINLYNIGYFWNTYMCIVDCIYFHITNSFF